MSAGRYCAVRNCDTNDVANAKLSFFRFPREITRCNVWIKNCGRSDLIDKNDKDANYCYLNMRLCSMHFEETMFTSIQKNRLKKTAIPTLFDNRATLFDNRATLFDNRATLFGNRVTENCPTILFLLPVVKNPDTRSIQICRTCMKEILDTSPFFYLDSAQVNTVNSDPTIGQKLHNCFPELDLYNVPNSVICGECFDTINSIYKFKNKCLQLEMQIQQYLQQMQQIDHFIDLIKVARFHHLGVPLKTGVLEAPEDVKHEELPTVVYDCDVFNMTDRLIKQEKIDGHYVFDKEENYVNCSTSAAEESHNSDQNCFMVNVDQDTLIENVDKTNICYGCYKCGYTPESKFKLNSHLKEHLHQKFLRSYKCFLCNYLTSYKCLFTFHNRSHLTKKNYKQIFKCRHIRKRFLKIHVQVDTDRKPFSCLLCDYHCKHRSSLQDHMRIHTDEKPFLCSICKYPFNSEGSLKHHMLVHTEKKLFACPFCDYQGSRKSYLKVHMRIHTGEKPFSCSFCAFRCNNKLTLNHHVQVHTQEKSFACTICEYRCNTSGNLSCHMRIHAGEKRFKC